MKKLLERLGANSDRTKLLVSVCAVALVVIRFLPFIVIVLFVFFILIIFIVVIFAFMKQLIHERIIGKIPVRKIPAG